MSLSGGVLDDTDGSLMFVLGFSTGYLEHLLANERPFLHSRVRMRASSIYQNSGGVDISMISALFSQAPGVDDVPDDVTHERRRGGP